VVPVGGSGDVICDWSGATGADRGFDGGAGVSVWASALPVTKANPSAAIADNLIMFIRCSLMSETSRSVWIRLLPLSLCHGSKTPLTWYAAIGELGQKIAAVPPAPTVSLFIFR